MSETVLILFIIIGFGSVRVVLEIVHTYLKVRWRKQLVEYKIADEVIKIYKKHKEQEKKKDWLSWEKKIKSMWTEYWAGRKLRKKERSEYGVYGTGE